MKKHYYYILPGLLACLFFFLWTRVSSTREADLPGGEMEENPALRAAWEHRLLADPATGEIPLGIHFLELQFAKSMPHGVSDRGGVDWVSRGPWNVGGRTRGLAIDITNENRILAGGVAGGIWLSEDGGQSWQRRTPLNAHPGCVSIAQDTRPGKTNIWYYLSGEAYGTSASADGAFYLGDGLFKSTDNGLNWAPVASTANGNGVDFTTFFQTGWRVVVNPAADTSINELYIATVGAVYKSTNGGVSWTAVRGGSLSAYSYFTDIVATPGGVLYATLSSDGPGKGIWRSTNGTNWINITPSNFPQTYNRIVIGVNPNDENEVWFLSETPGSGFKNTYLDTDNWSSLWRYRYLSDNGSGSGGSWEDRSAHLPSKGTQFDRFACQGGYDLVVKVQPVTNHVFIGGTCLYRSTDGFASGNNTTQIGGYKIGTELPFFELYPNHHPDLHDVWFLPSKPDVMITASDGGLHRTENCNAPFVEWATLNRGYQTSQFYTAIIEQTIPGDNTIIGGLQDNGNFFTNTSDPTTKWVQTVNGDGAYGAILDGKKGYVLSINSGRVVKCDIDENGVVKKFQRMDPIGPRKSDYDFINPLAIDPTDQNVLYVPAGRALYRQDRLDLIPLNNEWDSISQGWTRFPDTVLASEGVISAIAVSHKNPSHRVYLGTSTNRLFRIDNANTGSPQKVSLSRPFGSSANIKCIAVDPDNADNVMVAYSNYGVYSIYASENAGQTWRKVAGTLEQNISGSGTGPSVRWISILPLPNGKRKYFAGTSIGLFSADTLITHTSTTRTLWSQEGAGVIGNSVVDHLAIRPVDGLVVAATHSIGMFSANFTTFTATEAPQEAAGAKVYPNPARNRVRFEVPDHPDEKFKISIYTAEGRFIRETNATSGSSVDLTGMSPGVYCYRLQGSGWQKNGRLSKTE